MYMPRNATPCNAPEQQDLLGFDDGIQSIRPFALLENRIRRRDNQRDALHRKKYLKEPPNQIAVCKLSNHRRSRS